MNKSRNENLERILTSIHQHERFLIATHVRPDGDAIGSLLALTFILRRLGKTADPFCQDPTPPAQEFLPGAQSIPHQILQPALYEAAILVDCGDLMRVGASLAESIRRIPTMINIDHHVSSEPFGDIYWVEPGASSTCEMLYDLSLNLPIDLDSEIATQLYAGLITDTGSFRFANTSKRVLEIAANLVAAGAQPAFIAGQIYDSASPQSLKLLSMALSSLAFHAEDRLATAEVTQKMFADTGTSPSDSEGFINHLRSVKPVELAMLFRENGSGVIHVSMRSKGLVDVAIFAQRFGGGGHRHAAAFRVSGSMEGVRLRYTREAEEYLNRFEDLRNGRITTIK